MSRIEELDTIDGEVFLLRPSEASSAALAAAPANDHRPSYMQDQHIRLRRAMERAGSADANWLGLCFDVPGELDVDALHRAATTWLRRHEVMWGTFREDPADPEKEMTRHAIAPEELSLTVTPLGSHPGDEVNRVLLEHLSAAVDPVDNFGYAIAGISGDGRSTIFCALDHCYGDGFSVLLAYMELSALYAAETGGPEATLPPVTGYMTYAQAEREAAQQFGIDHPAMQFWADYAMDGAVEHDGFPMDLGIAEGERFWLIPMSYDILTGEECDRLEAIAKDEQATFPAVVYASFAMAARDLAGRSAYRFLNPVATRTTPDLLTTMGWMVNVLPIHIPVGPDEDLFEIARGVRRKFREARVCEPVPALRVVEVMKEVFGFSVEGTHRPSIVSYLDGRMIPGQEKWAQDRFYGTTGQGYDDDVNVWVNRTPTDLYVMCSVPQTPTAVENVDAFFTYASNILRGALTR
ncbi:MAG: condensation domain-containing protein [Aeromicrobium sp.]